VLKDGGVDIFCEYETSRFRFRLDNLERLRVDNFLQGNIVGDIFVYVGRDCPVRLIRLVYGLDDRDDDSVAMRLAREVEAENWTLVLIESSYGCRLVALARSALSVTTL
jgi:hypothetical protein